MRQLGVSCPNPRCRDDVIFNVEIEVSPFPPRMVSTKCGANGVDVRPNRKEMPIMAPKLCFD